MSPSSVTDLKILISGQLCAFLTSDAAHAVTVSIRGNSYRFKEKLKAGLVRAEEPAAAID